MSALSEAIARLDNADKGFSALSTLLADGNSLLEPEQMYCLIAPLMGDVHYALDELRTIKA